MSHENTFRRVGFNALLTAAFCGLITTPAVLGATSKSGIIADETWTSVGSPYNVDGDILVASLTIQPGVEVLFSSNYIFEVAGTLQALGTPDRPILFSTTNGITGWKGIFFNESAPGSFLTGCRVEKSTSSGIRITNSAPTFTNCVIANNTSSRAGGGVDAVLQNGTLIFDSCYITNNATAGSKLVQGGGGIFLSGNASFFRCQIAENTVNGGFYGGGLLVYSGNVTMKNSAIDGNTTKAYGGGIDVWTGTLSMMNCIVATNTAAGFGYGSGLVVHGNDGTFATIVNCTFVGNATDAIAVGNTVNLTNSILYFNNNNGQQIAGSPFAAYNDIQSGPAGNGNKSVNPVMNPRTLELLTGSPCIDAGNPSAIFNDVAFPPSKGTVLNDMGAYGGPGAALGIGPSQADQDGDGIPDAWMTKYFGHPTGLESDHSRAQDDADNDGLTNADEYRYGTDPTKADTDGDGYNDMAEITAGSDPLDPRSVPPPVLTLSVKQVELEFLAGNGQTNVIQASSDLSNWIPIEQFIGTGDAVSRIYGVTNGMKYFRLVRP